MFSVIYKNVCGRQENQAKEFSLILDQIELHVKIVRFIENLNQVTEGVLKYLHISQ